MITVAPATNVDLTDNPYVNSIMSWDFVGGAADAGVNFRNGGLAGEVFISVVVPAGESVHFFAHRPIVFPSGLFIQPGANIDSGSVEPG